MFRLPETQYPVLRTVFICSIAVKQKQLTCFIIVTERRVELRIPMVHTSGVGSATRSCLKICPYYCCLDTVCVCQKIALKNIPFAEYEFFRNIERLFFLLKHLPYFSENNPISGNLMKSFKIWNHPNMHQQRHRTIISYWRPTASSPSPLQLPTMRC